MCTWLKLFEVYDKIIKDSKDHFILVGSAALAIHGLLTWLIDMIESKDKKEENE